MIKFSIPTNWKYDLFPLLDQKHIDELYGTLADDFLGGGRPLLMLPKVSRAYFKQYIKEVHKRGMRFNYLLNATCIGNKELTRVGIKKLRVLLEWLADNSVEAITVSIPYLLEFIKYNYPGFKVYVSTMAGVDSLQRARYWQSLGADRITLSAVSGINRNFALLRQIRDNVKCELQLIVNLTCLYGCPFWTYHSVMYSHASQAGHRNRGFLIDYCFLRCNYAKLVEPAEFMRSAWIRPEDLGQYEGLGIERIKFANRNMNTQSIVKLITAYSQRHYEGNLLELFSDRSKQNYAKKYSNYLINKLKYLFRPFSVNIFRLLELSDLLDDPGIYIDNRALDGFLGLFLKEGCDSKSCQDCGYCRGFADKAVTFNADKRKALIEKYERCFNNLNSGALFTYFAKKEK